MRAPDPRPSSSFRSGQPFNRARCALSLTQGTCRARTDRSRPRSRAPQRSASRRINRSCSSIARSVKANAPSRPTRRSRAAAPRVHDHARTRVGAQQREVLVAQLFARLARVHRRRGQAGHQARDALVGGPQPRLLGHVERAGRHDRGANRAVGGQRELAVAAALGLGADRAELGERLDVVRAARRVPARRAPVVDDRAVEVAARAVLRRPRAARQPPRSRRARRPPRGQQRRPPPRSRNQRRNASRRERSSRGAARGAVTGSSAAGRSAPRAPAPRTSRRRRRSCCSRRS